MSLYDRDRGDEFRKNLDAAREPILAIARLLQRAAFVDSEERTRYEQPVHRDWQPAPLYIRQAVALLGHPGLREDLQKSLDLMQRRAGS